MLGWFHKSTRQLVNEVLRFTVQQQSLTELKFRVFDGLEDTRLWAKVILCPVAGVFYLGSQTEFA